MKRLKYSYKPKYYGGGTLSPEAQKQAQQDQTGNTAYSSGVNAVGAIPVVGTAISGITKLGDSIGTPIKNNAEKMNDDGTLKNRDASTAGLVAGSLLNPYKSLTRTFSDKDASTGEKIAAALTGGTSGAFYAKRYNNQLESTAQDQLAFNKQQEEAALAEQQRIEDEYRKQQQEAINRAYYSGNSATGNVGASIYAKYGGYLPKLATGGDLNHLASDVVKAEGATHEQGGIDLQANGKVFAEVEDQEVIHNNRVFSDRLKLDNKTYAEHAEKLGKQKSKYEKLVGSTSFRDKNTAERGMANVDKSLDVLFQTQEASKPSTTIKKFGPGGTIPADPYYLEEKEVEDPSGDFKDYLAHEDYWANDKSGGYVPEAPAQQPVVPSTTSPNKMGNNWGQYAQMAVPFVDNLYNAHLINKTPEVPKPSTRKAYTIAPTYMKTKYNVDNQLADVGDYYRNFTANVDATTNSSNVARANKLAGYAKTIQARNDIFANKENIETNLINQNNQNIQNVTAQNTRNKQDIDNVNLALTDQYNNSVYGRSNQMLRDKSANMANAVDDAGMLIRDKNMKDTDEQRIMVDSLRYNDASGYARLVGTPTMDNMIRDNPAYRDQIEKSLESGDQKKALADFRKRYPKKK